MKMKSISLLLCLWLAMHLSSGRVHAELNARLPDLPETDVQTIRAAYERAQHEIKPLNGGRDGFTAWNPGQGWRIDFDAWGFDVRPQQGCWSWGLELVAAEATERNATIKERGSRIEFQRVSGVTEWFVNDSRGLEHGWTLAKPVAGAAIRLRVRGGLIAEVKADCVGFGGELTYGGLKAWDANGKPVPVWFEAVDNESEFAVRYDDSSAQYPLTIDPLAQNAYLKASEVAAANWFGHSVAISSDTVVVGAPFASTNVTDSGAAFVFVRTGSGWEQQAHLKAGNTGAGDRFGWSVAVDGDVIVVGAPFEDGSGTTNTGDPSSNTTTNSGAVYVFRRSETTWEQIAYLKATTAVANLEFGESVAVSGDWVVVGAPKDSLLGASAGAAFAYVPSGASWFTQKITAANGQAGDLFGKSVAIHNRSIAVGAPGEESGSQMTNSGANDNTAAEAGAAYVFVRDGLSFIQEAYLKAQNSEAGDQFGSSVDIFENDVIVGAPLEDSLVGGIDRFGAETNNNAENAGAAYVFSRSLGFWFKTAYLKASNPSRFDQFGHSVSIAKDLVVVGAPYEDSNAKGVNGDQRVNPISHPSVGSAYVFGRTVYDWSQRAYLKASNSDPQDFFGFTIAVDGDTMVVGAYGESSHVSGINGDSTSNIRTQSGAAYVFDVWQSSLSKSGISALGVVGGNYGRVGSAVIANTGEAIWHQNLTGTGSKGGGKMGVFSTMAPGNESVDLVLQTGKKVSSYDLPENAIAKILSYPLVHQAGRGIYQAVIAGSGINLNNNHLVMIDNGVFTQRIFRTGEARVQLDNLVVKGWRSLLQARSEDAIQMAYQLDNSSVATVSKMEDSGVLVMNHSLSIQTDISSREGSVVYGGGGTFGQFGSLYALTGSPAYHAFVAPKVPSSPGSVLQSVFWRNSNGTLRAAVVTTGSNVVGAAGTTFRAFTGLSGTGQRILLRATLNGAQKTNNEVLWFENKVLARKGDDAAFGGLPAENTPGVKIARFVRYWPVDVSGNVQVVAQVQLMGAEVTSRNNQALILIQNDFTRMLLVRTGNTAPGLPGATLRTLSAVDINPTSGHYALLATLAGVPARSNQVLLTGHTQRGNNFSAERRPQPRLQKGNYYTSFHTPRGFIRSLALKPPVSRTGAGGIGLGQVVSANGNVLIEVTLDGKAVELVNVRR